MRLIPKNWDKHQHYKDRSPPWIKIHREILNDRVFMCLPIASKALAPLMWLLASESKTGEFDASIEELCFRLRLTESEVNQGLRPLIENGFFVVASGVLADCQHVAIPEREAEREAEAETKREGKAKPAKPSAIACPPNVNDSTWNDWLALRKAKRAPVTQTVIDHAEREAEKAGITLDEFLKIWCARGSQGLEASWLKPDERQRATSHTGFAGKNYSEGIGDDGRIL